MRFAKCKILRPLPQGERDLCVFDRERHRTDAMIIFPAIDLKDGVCVRLKKGMMDDATVFNTDPAAQARSRSPAPNAFDARCSNSGERRSLR